jgi:DedD protein
MRRVFDDEELEPEQPRRDTELTLSSMTLLAIFFGLVLLCGLCFGLGYTVGHRGSQPPLAAMQPSTGSQAELQPEITHPKPSATAPTGTAPLRQNVVVNLPPSTAPSVNPATTSQSSPPTPASVQPQVRPALPVAANTFQPAQPVAMQPAPASSVPLMVQIAAVSHQEDAEVLVSALRNRGYAVAARRDPADGLIHVRIGPFSSRDAANRWRLKLLGDGYNAIVQP